MSPVLTCPRCKLAVPSDAPGGLCLPCLLGLGLEDLPRSFAGYRLEERIGSGGMGVIYRAWELNAKRHVALKVIRTGELATAAERERFRREAQDAARLAHPNIVTIFQVGGADQPTYYYTMQLMTGDTLAEHLPRLRDEPRQVAQLVAKVARAVHHGHVRGILHRDLKPANILLDEKEQPHVADFGIASHVGDEDDLLSGGPLGTPHYMSPEQAGPPPRQLTTKSDVYSLGAILFELLTGRPPFDGVTADEVLEKQRTARAPRPRSLDPKIDLDLEAICLSCLQKDPERRPSAELLADDLERFLADVPVTPRPLGFAERSWRWASRHPAAAGSAATAALFLLVASIAALSIAGAQERERRQDVLKANAFAARALAGLALFELSQTVQVIERLAADPLVTDRLRQPAGAFDPAIAELRDKKSFVNITLQDKTGMAIARSPMPPDPIEYFGREWGWTDHFNGAKRRGEQGRHEAYLARPSRSEATGDYKFTISAPVFGGDGSWQGAVYASFATDSVLGGQSFPTGDDPRRTTALIARPDNTRETQGGALPRGQVVLVHEGLQRGKSYPISSPVLAALSLPSPDAGQLEPPDVPPLTDDNYRDPVPGFEGRWLAGIAPVGNTDYAIVVQTRYAAVLAPDEKLGERLLWWVGLPFITGGLAINLLLLLFRRRAR